MLGKTKKALIGTGIAAVVIGIIAVKRKQKKMIPVKRKETENN